jgi:hypothetical protein
MDPYQLDVFENYGKKMDSIGASGGNHHGYFCHMKRIIISFLPFRLLVYN